MTENDTFTLYHALYMMFHGAWGDFVSHGRGFERGRGAARNRTRSLYYSACIALPLALHW